MRKKDRSIICRILALILVVLFICPLNAEAVEPRASAYLTSYNAYPYAAGNGKMQIWFHVIADDYMDDIGSLSVEIYSCSTNSTNDSDWSFVTSFNNGNTPSMLGHGEYIYQSYVECDATVGRWYKAYVCIYAGDTSGGDTRYFWTSAAKAT